MVDTIAGDVLRRGKALIVVTDVACEVVYGHDVRPLLRKKLAGEWLGDEEVLEFTRQPDYRCRLGEGDRLTRVDTFSEMSVVSLIGWVLDWLVENIAIVQDVMDELS